MRKQYIKFECQHQKISRTDDFYVVGGSQKYLYAKFDFCEDWEGERQYAVFTGGGNTYRVEIVDGECEVPWEVLLTKRFFVGCEAGQRITSNAAEVVVHPCGAPEETVPPRKPTPTLQSQIGELAKLATKAKDSLVAAVNEIFSNFLPLKGGKLTGPLATDEVFVGGELSEDGKTWSAAGNKKALHVSGKTNLAGGLVVCDNADFFGKVVCDNTVTIKGEAKHEAPMLTRDVRVGGGYDENGEWDRNLGGGPSRLAVSGTLELHGEVKAENSSFKTHHMTVGGEMKVAGDTEIKGTTRIKDTLKVSSDLEVEGNIKNKGGKTFDMNGGDIKNVQSLRMKGTLQVENDSKLRSIKPLKKVDDTGVEQEVYNIGTDESYYDRGCFNRLRIGEPVRDENGNIVAHEYSEVGKEKLDTVLSSVILEDTLTGIVDIRPYQDSGWSYVVVNDVGATMFYPDIPQNIAYATKYDFRWDYDYKEPVFEELDGLPIRGDNFIMFPRSTEYPYCGLIVVFADNTYAPKMNNYNELSLFEKRGMYSYYDVEDSGCIAIRYSYTVPAKTILDKVNEVDAKLDAKFEEALSVQSNLEQNDPTQPDYIKGRTHWVEDGLVEIPVAGAWLRNDEYVFRAPIGLEAGKAYTVTWNGVDYAVIATSETQDGATGIALGNFTGETNEPFVIMEVDAEYVESIGAYGAAFPVASEGYVDFSIRTMGKIIHKLPGEFLPDGVPYSEGSGSEIILPECQPAYVADEGSFLIANAPLLEAGKTYTVSWNGVEYTCIGIDGTPLGETGTVALGDVYTASGGNVGSDSTGEPFVILTGHNDDGNGNVFPIMIIVPLDGTTDLTISISAGGEVIHKLDNKFLDLDWLPTRGEPQTLFSNQKLAFNHINAQGNSGYWGSNTSLGVLVELVAGKSYVVNWNGAEYKCVAKSIDGGCFIGNPWPTDLDTVNTREPFVICVVTGFDDIDGPVTGFYAEATQEEYEAQSEIYRSVIISETEGEINKLPEAFLPDGVPYVEVGITDFLPETDASSFAHPTFGKMWVIHTSTPNLKVGETYTVTYNGTPYECVCQAAPAGLIEDPNAVAMGNFSVVGGANTGEPFAMLVSFAYQEVDIIDLDGSSTVKVKIAGIGEIAHKMEDKCLPDTARVLVVKFAGTGDGNLVSLTHTYQQIYFALMNYTPVIACIHPNDDSGVNFVTATVFVKNGNVNFAGVDGGVWSHAEGLTGYESYYLDGDTSNRTIGNELWIRDGTI